METIPEDEQKNYGIFLDCVSTALIEKIAQPEPKPKKRTRSKRTSSTASAPASEPAPPSSLSSHPSPSSSSSPRGKIEPETAAAADPDTGSADELADFADYVAAAVFTALPTDLRTLDHHADADLRARYAVPVTRADVGQLAPALDPAVADTLRAYGVVSPTIDESAEDAFLARVLTSYIETATRHPPAPRATKSDAAGCELCGRWWVPLSYHHLVPRLVHGKAARRGWHRREDLQRVAWLCGACHRFVHRFAGHEELARRYYTVQLLLREEAVGRWVEWVGRLRWKGR
ncbi:hypothetical protein GGR52DRAFT_189980 [Hypoxylon sp. FL1284]|nr:hypothetical protein GGR52DRAFT_189980 [Hypoxylon sp. FL1284]